MNASDVFLEVEHGWLRNGDVAIHYTTLGAGPLLVALHGFPEFWYSWRHQLAPLGRQFQVVAIDQRGYNKSDKPRGREHYAMNRLVSDLTATIEHFGQASAVVMGHDWGGAVSWATAITRPQYVERLVILNVPHPKGLERALVHDPAQQAASQYVRDFQQGGAHKALSAKQLAAFVTNTAGDRERYIEALERSDFEAMLNTYQMNYPAAPYAERLGELPKVQCPVLMIHGLQDPALLPGTLAGTWDWIAKDLTLITVPDAGHFVHQDKPEFVNQTLLMWLNREGDH